MRRTVCAGKSGYCILTAAEDFGDAVRHDVGGLERCPLFQEQKSRCDSPLGELNMRGGEREEGDAGCRAVRAQVAMSKKSGPLGTWLCSESPKKCVCHSTQSQPQEDTMTEKYE